MILFTHADSLAGFRTSLPPSLEIIETTSLKRKYGQPMLNKVFGSTPWGLCDVAIVVPKGTGQARTDVLGEKPLAASR